MRDRSLDHPVFDDDESRALDALGPVARSTGTAPPCPDPALLLAVNGGSLDAEGCARVRAHVASCPACVALSEALARLVDEEMPADALARAAGRLAPATRRVRTWWPWLVPAGGLALAASSAWWLSVAPAPPTPPAGALLAMRQPAGAASVFQVDRPAFDSGDVELTLRGDTAGRPRLFSGISAALDVGAAGDKAAAVARLEQVVEQRPHAPEALLALGTALLDDRRTADALPVLVRGRALAAGPLAEEFDWYLSIAYVRSGDAGRAGPLLESLCRSGGPRSATACAGRLLRQE